MTILTLLPGIAWYCMVLPGIVWYNVTILTPPLPLRQNICAPHSSLATPTKICLSYTNIPHSRSAPGKKFTIYSIFGLLIDLNCENRQKLFDQDWKAGMCRGGVAGNGLWVEGSNLAVNFLPHRWLPPYLTASLHISNQPASDSKGAKLAGITDLPAGDTNILVRKKNAWGIFVAPLFLPKSSIFMWSL